ncbi:hypothetical protein BGX28_000840 [Mortierella sp. GBA30]|nr:hypothetical protein BGX28_000840 [Mortierella sp. GBA30]
MAGQNSALKDDHGISSSVKDATTSVIKRNVSNEKSSSKPDQQRMQREEEEEEEISDTEDEDDNVDDEDDSDESDSSDIDDIPEPEKWRIIKESGIIEQVQAIDEQSRVSKRHRHRHDDKDRDYVFEGIFFSIPTTCLFVVMDILVHRQFGENYGGSDVFRKVVKVFPAILIMVYLSNKSKNNKFTQAAMFIISTICGCYFLHTMFRSPAMGIMLRAPGIITILVYCVVQLDLLPAVRRFTFEMSFLFSAIKDYVYPVTAPSIDTTLDPSTTVSNPYSSNNSNDRIIVEPAPSTTLSAPTPALSLNSLQPPVITASVDSDSYSDNDSDIKIANPYAAMPAKATPFMTLSSADDPEVESTPSFPAVDGPQRLAACSTDPKSKRRIKFALAPGHSPLDWARLTSSGTDLRGVMGIGRYTLSDVKEHNSYDDAWTVLNGKVYNITPYLPFHPGGEKELMRCAGRDGTRLFNLTHKWVNYEYMLKECQVGFLVSEASTSNKLRV